MSEEIWKQFETAIKGFRPVFGNENHIRIRDIIPEINRMTKSYQTLKEERQVRELDGVRVRHSKRMDRLYDDITKLKRHVLDLMTV